MAGISSQALNFGQPENKKSFNGIEHTTDLGLNQYDAFFRNLDPQIGRFWQIDPKIESTEVWSPYAAMLDNPIRYADPLGDSVINNDANGLATASTNYNNKKAQYNASGNETKKQFRAAGHSGKEWRDFKQSRNGFNNATAAYNHTQYSIDNFKAADPTGYAKANSLIYTDKNGNVHNLDVLVSSGTVTNADKGQTLFGVNSATGVITTNGTSNVLNTTIDMNVSPTADVLAHELGHGVGIATDPLAYLAAYQALSNPETYDCQNSSNWNNILTRDAINMQHSYDAQLKTYIQTLKNIFSKPLF
jgi:RHS repeat-associated protein